ncbi:MAG TPA: hypothetical protein VNT26_17005 [Candidatus Sulfotelmatobacter sp.]|nr:hypothetical protein [Candidatus Sulfotelmatobacter sp.]
MQNLKSLLVLCVAAVCVLALTVRGVDNEAQAKARAALEQKLKELDPASPQSPAVTPAVPAAPATPATAAAPVAAPASEPEAIAKAREALRQKISELQAQQPAVAAQPSAPQPAAPTLFDAPAATNPEAIAKAQAALSQKMAELNAQAEAKRKTEQAAQKPAPVQAASKPKVEVKKTAALRFQPLEGPALPIAADKQQSLAELLRKYKADEITPEEYHQQRAKILTQ